MKRMTDEELEALAQHHIDMGNPAHVFMRALESAAYERAAMVCDALDESTHPAGYGETIRAMAKEST